MSKNHIVFLLIAAAFLACGIQLYARDHVFGPWNMDLEGLLLLESNSNIFYEETDVESDFAIHMIPKVRFEYEKLRNILFEAELELDSVMYTGNSDANVLEQRLHLEFKPVNRGMYAIFRDDYRMYQSYSDTLGLADITSNTLKAGGGYRGNHLDYSFVATLTQAAYTPSVFSSLDYTQNKFDGRVEYLVESVYYFGGIGFGNLDYADNAMYDASIMSFTVGMGKKFYPTNSVEVRLTQYTQDHDDGEKFSGLLYGVEYKHVLTSGDTSFTAVLEKEIVPSSSGGADYTEKSVIKGKGYTNISHKIAGEAEVSIETHDTGGRIDKYIYAAVKADYTPWDVKPLKFIHRKSKRPPKRANKPRFKIQFGLAYRSLASDIDTFDYTQMRINAGFSAAY